MHMCNVYNNLNTIRNYLKMSAVIIVTRRINLLRILFYEMHKYYANDVLYKINNNFGQRKIKKYVEKK